MSIPHYAMNIEHYPRSGELGLLLFTRPKDSPTHSLITSSLPQRSACSTSKVGQNEQARLCDSDSMYVRFSEIIFVVFCKRILSEIVVTTFSIYLSESSVIRFWNVLIWNLYLQVSFWNTFIWNKYPRGCGEIQWRCIHEYWRYATPL